MSSLTAPVFENSDFVAEIYFIFLKTRPKSNFKCFQCPNLDLSEKIGKVVIK